MARLKLVTLPGHARGPTVARAVPGSGSYVLGVTRQQPHSWMVDHGHPCDRTGARISITTANAGV